MTITKPSKNTVQEILNQLEVDAFGGLEISDASPSAITSGSKTSTGTAVQLAATATPVRRVLIQAFAFNTNVVAVGGPNVVAAADATAIGVLLNAGDAYEIDIDDLSKVYIRSITSGEGVTYVATN